ncbi:5-formyltetrahydrofolate cyclo-ligase [Pedosphaera parvula]|uniref:5-formyltetrahydrofolate cyclo-ligase n=1 Tax=Pedosphaera parvula (strain Ellin514) TaxID=320771 RepID=B9XID5_PEDPL|nr:5-formyltetrahydrofolate cyclo-ligase [Pedosphaera parvula]EEF60396.1 5-formyltetrahydrofolate cyclo-ligase [Pedosphaera parvula Ellin514]
MDNSPSPNHIHKHEKATLRAKVRTEVKKLSQAERQSLSLQLCSLLEQQEIWKQAQSILFYAPLPDEPDIWKLVEDSIATGKTVLLPRFHPEQNQYVACHIKNIPRDLSTGQYGVREPNEFCSTISLNHLDLILVPGVAFDFAGHRLGRGKGFYDQLLEVLHGTTCGVAFDQQILDKVPVEPHDIRLSCILTPTRWQSATPPRPVLK